MMSRKDQEIFLGILGLSLEDVTDYTEIENAKGQLKQSGQWDSHRAKRFSESIYEITNFEAVKKAWRSKCKEFHPDTFDEAAYKAYIEALSKSEGEDSITPVLSLEEMMELFREATHAYKMLTDPFYAIKNVKDANKTQKSLDAVFNVTINFEQAFFGDSIVITFNPIYIDDSGKPVKMDEGKNITLDAEVITIRVKEGSKTGDRVTVRNKGLCSGDIRGDLVINLQVVPHLKFTLEGPDVVETIMVPLDIMLTGGDIETQTMWGLKTLRIPAGTKPKDRLKIPSCGVQKIGDHCVIVEPQYPEKEELKENKVWKKLGINWNKEQKRNEEELKDEELERTFEGIFRGTYTFAGSGGAFTTGAFTTGGFTTGGM